MPRQYNRIPIAKRFWSKVNVLGPDDCWLWLAGGWKDRYGAIWDETTKTNRGAHQVSWELQNGAIPEGLLILHKCNVYRCVNPNHLYAGTFADNNQDMMNAGHHINTNVKLTPPQVVEIRKRRRAGEKLTILAGEFHVDTSTVSLIGLGKIWRELEDDNSLSMSSQRSTH